MRSSAEAPGLWSIPRVTTKRKLSYSSILGRVSGFCGVLDRERVKAEEPLERAGAPHDAAPPGRASPPCPSSPSASAICWASRPSSRPPDAAADHPEVRHSRGPDPGRAEVADQGEAHGVRIPVGPHGAEHVVGGDRRDGLAEARRVVEAEVEPLDRDQEVRRRRPPCPSAAGSSRSGTSARGPARPPRPARGGGGPAPPGPSPAPRGSARSRSAARPGRAPQAGPARTARTRCTRGRAPPAPACTGARTSRRRGSGSRRASG